MGLLTARPSSAKFAEDDPCFLDVEERPDWQRQFGNCQPLKLEIGFGMGDFLIEMAGREPNSNFIGIDFSQNGIRKLLARINSLQLKNIRVVYGDVRERLPLLFEDRELDTVFINFPDPWPGKRHFRRRLIKPELVKMMAQKLAPEGRLYLATDSESYAMEILEYFNAEPALQNIDRESGILESRGHLPKTKYEKSFIYAGDRIYYLEYVRLVSVSDPENSFNKPPSTIEVINSFNETDRNAKNNDELLTKKFQDAEAGAQDACDLKKVADNLADAGDKQWAGKVYRKAENKAQDSLDLNWLAYSVSEALGDEPWARELFRKAERSAQGSLDYNWLAYSVYEALGDKGWAKDLFKKAEVKPDNVRELCDLADSISVTLADKEWETRVYRLAEVNAEEYSDFYELADSVYAKLGDSRWARELYMKAEAATEDCSDLHSLAERIFEKLGDKEWAVKVYKKAESKAVNSGDFRDLADGLCHNLRDEAWAIKLYLIAEGKAEESYECRWLAESLRQKLGDKEWAEKLYKKAENKADAFYDNYWLAESVCESLGDKEWAKEIGIKAKKKAKDPSDLNRLANALSGSSPSQHF